MNFGLPCSIGVASNKLVAKIATEKAKPNNICLVPVGEEAAFLAPLPVRALWGVGPKTAEILKALNIETIGQIAQARSDVLAYRLGKRGAEELIQRARASMIHPSKTITSPNKSARRRRSSKMCARLPCCAPRCWN